MDKSQSFEEFLDALEAWYDELDRRMKEWMKKSERPISCFACTHAEPGCCYQKVFIPFHEALPIARYIKASNLDTPELREQLRTAGEEMEGTDRSTWFHELRRPCVFLKDGRCSIYRIRPIPCRIYHVITHPDRCQPGVHEGIHHLDTGMIEGPEIARSREIHRALNLKETRKRILMGALPRLVLVALEVWDSNDYQETVRHQRWPTDESIFNEDWIEGRNPFNKLYQIRVPNRPAEE